MGTSYLGSAPREQRGYTVIETLIAVGILGLIAPAVLLALSTFSHATRTHDQKSQATALARSQLETIEASPYLDCDPSPCYPTLTNLPYQYAITTDVEILDSPTCQADGNCNTLQQVTVAVSRPTSSGSRTVLRVSAYKVRR